MTRNSIFRFGAALAGLFLLSSCQMIDLAGEPGPYDGRWVGRLMLSIGEKKCLRRLNIAAEVINGRMTGKVEHGRSQIHYNGRIEENGEMPAGIIIQRDYGNEGIMTGTFTETNASGKWKNRRCEGKWTLRRVSTGNS